MTSRPNVLASTTFPREDDARTQPALPSEAPGSLSQPTTDTSRSSPPPEPSMSTAFPLVASPTTPPPDAVLISRDNVHFFVKGIRLFPAFRNVLPARGPRVSGLPSARGPSVAGLPSARGSRVEGMPSVRGTSVAGLPSVGGSHVEGLPSVRGSHVAGLPSARAPDTAETLNIILHAALNRELVGLAFTKCAAAAAPSVSAIGAAVDRFNAYGLDASVLLASGRPLHKLLTAQIPSAPLAVYVVAARADAGALAAAASAHLLGEPVHKISDERAEAMGAVYLKRLFMLHRRRVDALRELLGRAPGVHEGRALGMHGDRALGVHEGGDGGGEECEDRGTLVRRWDNVTAEIVVNAKPDTPASHIELKLSSIARHLACEPCKASLEERIEECVADWSAVGRTI